MVEPDVPAHYLCIRVTLKRGGHKICFRNRIVESSGRLRAFRNPACPC